MLVVWRLKIERLGVFNVEKVEKDKMSHSVDFLKGRERHESRKLSKNR